MIWKCEQCGKHWRYEIERCVFGEGEIQEVQAGAFTIIGVTEVFVPSDEHERVPYYNLLMEDEHGNKYIKKTFDKYELGSSLVIDATDNKPDVTIGVIGTGTLGVGIAHVAVESGFNVILKSRSDESLNKARENIKYWLQKTRNEADTRDVLDNIHFTTDMQYMKNSNFIIEAVIEDFKVKEQTFQELGKVCEKDTIIASNTSSLSISELSSGIQNPSRVVGMHFFNPVQKMELVEVIRGNNTSQETIDHAIDVAKQFGKTAIVAKDTPGFIVNRILMPLLSEAIYALDEGVANAEDIDTAIKLGLNHPMGPLELADLIGLDVCLAIMQRLYDGFNDEKYKPSTRLTELVEKGCLGRKTGEGFYKY